MRITQLQAVWFSGRITQQSRSKEYDFNQCDINGGKEIWSLSYLSPD